MDRTDRRLLPFGCSQNQNTFWNKKPGALSLPSTGPMAQEHSMAQFFTRLVSNDHVRRGLAGAVSSVLIGVIVESVWPSAR